MKNVSKKIPILDILGHGTFQSLNGNEPEMAVNGTRVTLFFAADQRFFELSERFNQNEPVPVLDFLNAQRRLKAKMLLASGESVESGGNAAGSPPKEILVNQGSQGKVESCRECAEGVTGNGKFRISTFQKVNS